MAGKIYLFAFNFAVLLITILSIQRTLAQESAPATLKELKLRLETEMHKQHIAGMMLTIVDQDSVLFSGGLGYAVVDKKILVTEKHLFRGASITKLFVALGIMNLVRDGKLSVKTKLKDIAPEIQFKNKWEMTNPITIEELMEHTSGFSDKSPFEEYNFTGKAYTGIQAMKVFENFMTSKWKPGERHAYSSVNYAILDYIIEKVSGQPIQRYVRERIFNPMGMPYANLELTDDGSDRYSKGYVWKNGYFQLAAHQPAFNAGYSSLNISALDFTQALKSYLNNWQTPKGQFLSKDILKETETPHSYLSASAGLQNTYAYGNESQELAGEIFRGHRGAIGGFLSAFLYNRQLGLGYAFAVNTHNESFYRFADHLISQFALRNSKGPAPVPTSQLNEELIQPYLGYYKLSNPGQLYTGFFERLTNTIKVERAENELNIKILGRGAMKWQAADKTGLRYKNAFSTNSQILFLKDSDNNPVIVDGTMYFEKITPLGAWAPIVFFIVSVLIVVSTLFFGLANLALFFMKKIPPSQLSIRLLALLPAAALLLILLAAAQLFEHMKEAAPMNGLFTIWLLGKWLFAVSTLLTVILLALRWKSLTNKVLKVYLSILTCSCCYLLIIFFINDWF